MSLLYLCHYLYAHFAVGHGVNHMKFVWAKSMSTHGFQSLLITKTIYRSTSKSSHQRKCEDHDKQLSVKRGKIQ